MDKRKGELETGKIARQTLFDYIMEHPGCYPFEIARETGLKRGTINYHLDRMKAAGIVRMEKLHGKQHCYFEAGYEGPTELLTDIQQEILSKIAKFKGELPFGIHSKFATQLGISRQVFSYHFRKLKEEGYL